MFLREVFASVYVSFSREHSFNFLHSYLGVHMRINICACVILAMDICGHGLGEGVYTRKITVLTVTHPGFSPRLSLRLRLSLAYSSLLSSWVNFSFFFLITHFLIDSRDISHHVPQFHQFSIPSTLTLCSFSLPNPQVISLTPLTCSSLNLSILCLYHFTPTPLPHLHHIFVCWTSAFDEVQVTVCSLSALPSVSSMLVDSET